MDLVDTKVAEGKIEDVETEPGEEPRKSADIIDLTELLKRSLGNGKKVATKTDHKAGSSDDKKSAETKTTKSKTPTKKTTAASSSKTASKKSAETKTKPAARKSSSK